MKAETEIKEVYRLLVDNYGFALLDTSYMTPEQLNNLNGMIVGIGWVLGERTGRALDKKLIPHLHKVREYIREAVKEHT
jgi:hypothetical protein